MTARSLRAAFNDMRDRFAGTGMDDAALDARLLLQEIAGVTAADLIARPEMPLDEAAAARLEEATLRRIAGEPVHRILGHRPFHGLDLKLSPETLEPRPDTEVLVDLVLPFLRDLESAGIAPLILDLGTGTGAIALALLKEVPGARATAADISRDALSTARANAAANGLEGRVDFVLSHWFSAVRGKYHLIVSNPPYICSSDIAGLAREVRDHDPMAALDGGPDGLNAYRAISREARKHLADGGRVAVEIGQDQGEDVIALFAAAGFVLHRLRKDLGDRDRAIMFAL